MRELSRERKTRRSQWGFANEIKTRANETRRDEKCERERERNWIEGKSKGTVLLLTWRVATTIAVQIQDR